MSIFVDTSGLLAVLNADDIRHADADSAWRDLLESDEALVCSNYVFVETFALAQNRQGIAAVRALDEEIRPALTLEWVTEADHRAGVSAVLATGRRQVSLVDCVSFVVMRRMGIRRVFALDPHFEEFGFESLPAQPH